MTFTYREFPIYELDQKIRAGEFKLNPGWQRKYIWKRKEQELLINSLLRGIPIPFVYLTESEKDGKIYTFNVIDGQQRLTTIHLFYNNRFSIIFDGVKSHFENLPKELQNTFSKYVIMAYTIENYSHDDIVTLFERLNTKSTRLTKIELWNCSHYKTVLFRFLRDIERDIEGDTRTYIATLIKKVYKQSERLRMKPLYDLVDLIYCSMHDKVTDNKNIDKQIAKFVEGSSLFTENEREIFKRKLNLAAFSILTNFPEDQIKSSYSDKRIFGFLFLAVLLTIDKYFIPKSINLTHALIDYSQEHFSRESLKNKEQERSIIVDEIMKIIIKYSKKLDAKRFFDDEIRNRLWQTNGKVCKLCNQEIKSIVDCTVDHIEPWSLGGKTKIENAQLAHKSCNSSKSNKAISDEYGFLYLNE
jgi:hypothetical protein